MRWLLLAALLAASPCGAWMSPVVGSGGATAAADVTAPTVSSTTVATNGDTVTIVFDETVVTTGYDNGDFDLDCDGASGANNALTTITGSGSSRSFTATSTVQSGETCNLDYTGTTDEIEDSSGNDLATFSDASVTNNSTQGASCSTQTARASCTSVDWKTGINSGAQAGQKFQVSAGGTLYSVKLHLFAELMETSESGTLTLRFDDDEDMSSEYMDSCTLTVSDGDPQAWIECVMVGQDQTLSTSTDYYVMVDWSRDSSDNIQLTTYNDDANCITTGTMYDTLAADWGLTGHEVAGEDLLLEVMICD